MTQAPQAVPQLKLDDLCFELDLNPNSTPRAMITLFQSADLEAYRLATRDDLMHLLDVFLNTCLPYQTKMYNTLKALYDRGDSSMLNIHIDFFAASQSIQKLYQFRTDTRSGLVFCLRQDAKTSSELGEL